MQRLLTKKEVAKFLGVSERTVDRYRKKRGLETVGGVGRPRFSKDDVNWFLRKGNKMSKSRATSLSFSSSPAGRK